MDEGALVLDRAMRVLFLNRSAERLLAIPRGEVLGRKAVEAFPESRYPLFSKHHLRLLREGREQQFTVFFSGIPCGNWFEVRLLPVSEGMAVLFRTTTENRRIVHELAASEQRFSELVGNLPVTVFELDQHGRITFANEEGLRAFAYSNTDLEAGLHLQHVVHQFDHATALAAVEKLLRQEERLVVQDLTMVRKTGDSFPGRVYAHGIAGHDAVLGVRGIVLDLTETKTVQEELEKRERKYRTLFDHSNDAIFLHDMEGRLLKANKMALQMFELQEQDLPRLRVYDLHPPDSDGRCVQAFDEVRRDGFVRFETEFITSTGRRFSAEVSARVMDIGGSPIVQGIVRDTEQRRDARQRLEDSERLYRNLFENTGTATIIFDNDGIIYRSNHEFSQLSGYSREQIDGRMPWVEFVAPEDRERMMEYHRRRLQEDGDVPRDYSFVFVDCKGQRKDVQVRVSLIPGSTDRIAALLDITERKKTQQELLLLNRDLERLVIERTAALTEKSEELEALNNRLLELDTVKSSQLSTVSHDIRTPLTSVLGFVKLIERDFIRYYKPLGEKDPHVKRRGEQIEANLAIIVQEGERLARLINDFLDLSRIESGRMDWHDGPLAFQELVDQAVNAVRGRLALKPGLRLRTRLEPRLPDVVADMDRMLQVLVNLLDNAVKFTDQGEVLLELFEEPPGWLLLRVTDTGVGIPESELGKIFDKFHQAVRTDTLSTRPEGTGMGLAICKQIVSHYNGSIEVSSALGQGSCITVRLPAGQLPRN